jgi:hypothetical protein
VLKNRPKTSESSIKTGHCTTKDICFDPPTTGRSNFDFAGVRGRAMPKTFAGLFGSPVRRFFLRLVQGFSVFWSNTQKP